MKPGLFEETKEIEDTQLKAIYTEPKEQAVKCIELAYKNGLDQLWVTQGYNLTWIKIARSY